MNIPGKFKGISVTLEQNGPIPSLEKMADSFGLTVKIICVACIDMMQNGAQVSSGGLKEKMVVIGKKAKTVNYSAIAIGC